MSRKKIAIGTVAFLISLSFTVAVLVTSFSIIEAINPIAAATAITVAVVGIIWFKKPVTNLNQTVNTKVKVFEVKMIKKRIAKHEHQKEEKQRHGS